MNNPGQTSNVHTKTQLTSSQSSDFHQLTVLDVMRRANLAAQASESADMVQGFINLMVEITQADLANYFQIDPASNEMVISNICGDPDGKYLIGLRLNRQRGLPVLSASETKITVVDDLIFQPHWLELIDPIRAARNRNMINVPVVKGDHTLGFIQIFNFQQLNIDLLANLQERLGLEIDNRIELTNARTANLRLETLVESLGEITGTLDRNHLLHKVTENASRLVGAERSSVFLVDPSTREMIFQVAYQSPENETLADESKLAARNAAKLKVGPFRNGEFSHFNRHAITVPLRSEDNSGEAGQESGHVLGGLMVFNRQNAAFKEEDARLMQFLAQQASVSLQVTEMYETAGELFLGVIKALAAAIDAKDPSTQGHSQRVSDIAVLMARVLGYDELAINDLRIGSLLHDIGKIGIPDQILLKNGRLDEREYEIIKQHPNTGVNILNQVRMLEPMIPAILEHHERLNGSGYPARLAGKQISWLGRIVAVADVYDAMTSDRPYRKGSSQSEALAYLNEKSEILFDGDSVHALEHVLATTIFPNTRSTNSLNPNRAN